MFQTSGFEQIAEALVVDRLEDEATSRANALIDARNLEVVTLGACAVTDGLITHDNVCEITWQNVARHRQTMASIGYAPLRRPELSDRKNKMDLTSQRVKIAPDISISLKQQTRAVNSCAGFWNTIDNEGIEAAIGHYSCPGSTLIVAYDHAHDISVMTMSLAPDSTSSPDDAFRARWERHMHPFTGMHYKSAFDRQNEKTLSGPKRMTDKQLIVAAGFNLVFSGMLDEIESHID